MLEAVGEYVLQFYPQSFSQENNFLVGHTADLRFDFGDRIFADVPARARATRRQHGLRPVPLVADFSHNRPDDVLERCHARWLALTICAGCPVFLPISE